MATTVADAFLPNLAPPPLKPVWNGNRPDQLITERAADLPGVVALPVRQLVPSLPEPIWSGDPAMGPTDLEVIRAATRTTVQGMDWSKIENWVLMLFRSYSWMHLEFSR